MRRVDAPPGVSRADGHGALGVLDYRDLFEHMLDGFALHEIVCDADGKPIDFIFLAVNPAFETQTGLQASELIGRRALEALPGTDAHLIEAYGRVALTGRPTHFAHRSRDLGRHFEVTAYRPAEGRFACIFHDVTKRERALARLRESEERRKTAGVLFEAVFDQSAEGFAVANATGRYVMVNSSLCQMTGYGRDELLQMGVQDLMPADGELLLFPRVVKGHSGTRELELVRRDGSRFLAEIMAVPLMLGGERLALGVVRDITAARAAELAQETHEERGRQAARLESLSVLAGGIAHDFNNLLAGIMGNAHLLRQHVAVNPSATEKLDNLVRTAERAADLVRQMLAYAGRGELVVEAVDANAMLEELSGLLQVNLGEHTSLQRQYAKDLPLIRADATQIRQLLMNLITNAAESFAGAPGEIKLRTAAVTCDRQRLGQTWVDDNLEPGSYVQIEVADSGCGMNAATLMRVFDPFFSTKFAGRGLGMAATLGFVRGNGGAIEIDSTPDLGTAVRLLFPALTETDGSASQVGAQPAEAATPATLEGCTVLVVDDDDVVRETTGELLAALGYRVITAAGGREGVAIYARSAAEIDAVLLDYAMPDLDGERCLAAMRALKADVKALLISGYDAGEVQTGELQIGDLRFVQKPFSLAELQNELRALLAE